MMSLSDIAKKYTQAIPVNVVVYKSTPTFINSGAVLLFVTVCLSRKSDLPKKKTFIVNRLLLSLDISHILLSELLVIIKVISNISGNWFVVINYKQIQIVITNQA